MFASESAQDLLHLPEHTSSCKLSEFTIPCTEPVPEEGVSPSVMGGGFVGVNMYGDFPISVGRIDFGILENHSSMEGPVGLTLESTTPASSTKHLQEGNKKNAPTWSSEEDALNRLLRMANASSNKCTATDVKIGGCGIVLYFTSPSFDTPSNRKLLMLELAKELVSYELTYFLCLPGIGMDLQDLVYLREGYVKVAPQNNSDSDSERDGAEEKKLEASPKRKTGIAHSPSFISVQENLDAPIPKLMLPDSLLPQQDNSSNRPMSAPPQDLAAKFAAYSAYGSISTLSQAKGWISKKKRSKPLLSLPSPSAASGVGEIKPKVILLGLTNSSYELYRLLKQDGGYSVLVSNPAVDSEFEIPSEDTIEWSEALTVSCHILMPCTWQSVPIMTASVIEEQLKCLAVITLSDNLLPTDKDERESSYVAFAKKGMFDLVDGVCDLGAYAKVYSLSQEAASASAFTFTDSYQLGVKVMDKAIHLDGIVQQYDEAEMHQFYSMILEEEDVLDDIKGAHLGLGTIIGNSSDRMTEWMWTKVRGMCPALRSLKSSKSGGAGGPRSPVNYLDLGAGSGAAARWICSQDPSIHVKCINISAKQNAENRHISDESGLGGQVSVETGSFERLPPEYSNTFDGCLSQDSFLHSFEKENAFAEALRVTKGGGWLMISDLMCGEGLDVSTSEFKAFAEKNNVTNWVTPSQCVELAKETGWADVSFTDCTAQIKVSLQGLLVGIKDLINTGKHKGINLKLLQTQRLALSNRIGQIDRGVFKWGIISARKPYDVLFITKPPVDPEHNEMMNYSTNDIDGNLKFGTDVVVLTIKDGMPREKIMELPTTTRLIVTMSAGLDHVDLDAAKERGIKVRRAARDQLVKSVADYTLSSLVFGLRDGFRNIGVPFPGAKDWNLSWNAEGIDLDRAKIGFIGVGMIVEETCRRIRALSSDCELVYHVPPGIRSRFEEGTFRMYHVGLADLLSTCDCVVVLCPLTKTTANFMGYKEFTMMKKNAIFINMARGKIVDTEAMCRAMKEKVILHSILDTTEPEPLPKDHDLWSLDNVTITPHFATNTHYVRKELVEDIANQVEDALEGRGILRLEELSARQELSEAYRITREFGMDELVWNHISVLLSDGTYLITPGSLMFDDIRPQDLVKSGGSGNVTADIIHDAIYKYRPDVNAIVHLHTPATVAVSCLEMGFVPLAQEAAPFVGRVGTFPWNGVSNDYEEQKLIGEAVKNQNLNTLVMENHGFCTMGKTLGEAWVLAYYFDKACQTQLNCLQTGQKIRYPDPKVLAHAAEQAKLPEFLPGACEWDALRKMLTRKRR